MAALLLLALDVFQRRVQWGSVPHAVTILVPPLGLITPPVLSLPSVCEGSPTSGTPTSGTPAGLEGGSADRPSSRNLVHEFRTAPVSCRHPVMVVYLV